MDKNTIWAIVLSALVLVGAGIINVLVIAPRQQAFREQQQTELLEQSAIQEKETQKLDNSIVSFGQNENKEQEFTVKTDKLEVVFTNRGGDIISYRLLEHEDKKTGASVQMADNITGMNRAFSVAFGDSLSTARNEIFTVRRDPDNENSIIFYYDFEDKNVDGQNRRFRFIKRYEFRPGDYVFSLGIELNTFDDKTGFNKNGAAYTIRTSPQIGPHYDRKADRYEVRQYLSLNGGKRTRKAFSSKVYEKSYSWAGVGGKYFAILVKPENPESMTHTVRCSTETVSGYENAQIFLTRAAIPAQEDSIIHDNYYIYVGPRSENELIKYNSADKNAWGLFNVKFNQALQTSGFLSFIEVALKWALEIIYKVVKNWGVAIIILTIILKIILFPLNKSSSLGTLKMQQLQPRMQEIQEKYKDNQQKLSEETAKLYKEAGYNPVSGCLPMILQMIILFSLYNVFNNYFEFRGASFIKGWIDDLSVGDSIWSWERSIPLLSGLSQNNVRILPFIYLASQLLNSKITQYGGAASAQNKNQMMLMMYVLPVAMFFIFYNVPSGLLLYWTTSNILQIGQQLVINSIMKKKRAELEKNKPQVNKNVLKFKGGMKKTR